METSAVMIVPGALLLLAGCLLCLIAAVGVLRLPDFFMRMHAATKAGFAGCGLVLTGLALIDGDAGTAVKVSVILGFLLVTTPLAGHLLGRAAYVGGAPMWEGTRQDALAEVLERGRFDATAPSGATRESGPSVGDEAPTVIGDIRVIVLALIEGPTTERAIGRAIGLARLHRAELQGVAVIDAPRLANVGPVPIGAGWHAQGMRERRLRLAREAAARAIQRFETSAARSGLVWSVRLEEGRPDRIFSATDRPGTLLVVAGESDFDHGILDRRTDLVRRLGRGRRGPVMRLV